MTRNCMIGQSGGPTAAINASLAGVISGAVSHGFEHIYGLKNGIQGLLEGTYFELDAFRDEKQIELLKRTPAMYLGSCRYKLPEASKDETPYIKIFDAFKQLNITDFYYIGGNDSMDTVMKLSAYAREHHVDVKIIGVPKTIDNDLMGTDHTPGFGSAAKYVATSLLEIIYDSRIYKVKSVTIVEIMGRNAGWLTAAACLARMHNECAPDLIYLPEVAFDKERFLSDIGELLKDKNNVIVAVSEGVRTADGKFLDADDNGATDVFGHAIHSGTGKILENLVKDYFGCKVRSVELNVLQRCASHLASKADIDESFMVGKAAVDASVQGLTEKMMVYKRQDNPYTITIDALDVREIANLEKKIPLEWITKDCHDVTEEMYNYLLPLVQGEVDIPYENGIPHYLDISHLM